MNQRIKVLAIQAGAGEWGDSVIPAMMNIEKFAELIIGECIRLCDQVDVVGADECIDNIKEHFEVEE